MNKTINYFRRAIAFLLSIAAAPCIVVGTGAYMAADAAAKVATAEEAFDNFCSVSLAVLENIKDSFLFIFED